MPTVASNNTMQESSSRPQQSAVTLPPATVNPLSDAEQERMHRLGLELRCLVCQNQSISDSNSGLAVDLRKQIEGQIREGKSDAAIKQYMVERYGDFVLYKPSFSLNNAALWIGPFLLLLIGIVLAARSIKRRKIAATDTRIDVPVEVTSSAARLQKIEARYQRESKR